MYWYNNEHRSSRIKFVTPNQRHGGLDIEILAKQKVLYQQKRSEHPERWSKSERNWQPIGAVELTPSNIKMLLNNLGDYSLENTVRVSPIKYIFI